ncbi:MAG: hypothetical protein P8Q99_11175 [Paracoccaceae bacterium]|nr:hypothetical protein RB2150_00694 [Rhodobacterales bacterium HTCC2150] [Rhodobacteraceae bacterium HTCC2150]MDG1531903.1 hypothetical protein [Paracoccaceae bacterium]
MNKEDRPVFLESDGYRLRRIVDALRFLPFLGIFFVVVPGIMLSGAVPRSLSGVGIYFFAIWIVLILLTAILTRVFAKRGKETEEQ